MINKIWTNSIATARCTGKGLPRSFYPSLSIRWSRTMSHDLTLNWRFRIRILPFVLVKLFRPRPSKRGPRKGKIFRPLDSSVWPHLRKTCLGFNATLTLPCCSIGSQFYENGHYAFFAEKSGRFVFWKVVLMLTKGVRDTLCDLFLGWKKLEPGP